MPIPKSPTTLQSSSFNMAANPDAIPGVQANETFLLTADTTNGSDVSLGGTGETVGFAKYQFDIGKFQQLESDMIALQGKLENAPRSRNGLANALAADEVNPDLVAAKRADALKELKKFLPRDQRAGAESLGNDQIIAQLDQIIAENTPELAKMGATYKAMGTIVGLCDALYGNQPAPPDRALLARTVASSQVDQLLGTNCVAEEVFGMDKDGKAIGVSIQGDGAGIIGKFRDASGEKKDCLLEVDLKNPQIQRGLADLEAVDYLTGQIDRHCGNIFVDPKTGKVTGIDNDMAFPEVSREAMFASKGEFTTKAVTGMPRQMHQDTAQKILALSPQAMRDTLAKMPVPPGVSPLSPAAINSACDRLAKLQSELMKPGGGSIQVVPKFDDNTYNAAMAAQEAAMQQHNNKSIDENLRTDHAQLDKCIKTSYLGSAVMQSKRYKLGIEEEPAKYGVRPAAETGPAPRLAETAAYTEQIDRATKILAANPKALETQLGNPAAAAQAKAAFEQIDALKAKIANYDREIAKLDNGGIGAKLRSLASLGPEGRKEFYADKKIDAMRQIGNIQRGLEGLAQQSMTDDFKAGLRQQANLAVQKQQAAQNVAPPVPAQNAAQLPDFIKQQAPTPPIEARVALKDLPPPVAAQNAAQLPDFIKQQAPTPPIEARVALKDLPPPVADQNAARVPLNELPQPDDMGNSKNAKQNIPSKTRETSVADQTELESGLEAQEQVDDASLTMEPESLSPTTELSTHGVESSSSTNTQTQAPKRNTVGDALKRSTSLPDLNTLRQGKALGEDGAAGEKPEVKKDNSLRASGDWQSAKPSTLKPGGTSLTKSH